MQIITQEDVRFNTCRTLLHRLSPFCVARFNSLIFNFANKKTSMARSTFKVLFYVNGSKEKNGIVPIMGRVTINGSVADSYGVYVFYEVTVPEIVNHLTTVADKEGITCEEEALNVIAEKADSGTQTRCPLRPGCARAFRCSICPRGRHGTPCRRQRYRFC